MSDSLQQKLSAYHMLNEDEFEMEVLNLLNREPYGPRLLRQIADVLDGQAEILRTIADNYGTLGAVAD